MTVHELKTWPPYFADIVYSGKTFEYRLNDRDYQVGDFLLLREFDPLARAYTGRECFRVVTYIAENIPGLPAGFCVMSIVKHGTMTGLEAHRLKVEAREKAREDRR